MVEVGRNDPPAAPVSGDCYIVGAAPSGAWSGQARALACFTDSGWRFAGAVAGMRALDLASGCVAAFDGTAWSVGELRATQVTVGGDKVVGARQAGIADHASDATVNAILAALRAHGLIAS